MIKEKWEIKNRRKNHSVRRFLEAATKPSQTIRLLDLHYSKDGCVLLCLNEDKRTDEKAHLGF